MDGDHGAVVQLLAVEERAVWEVQLQKALRGAQQEAAVVGGREAQPCYGSDALGEGGRGGEEEGLGLGGAEEDEALA